VVLDITGRSTLAAILFHFVGNAFGELFALSARAEVYSLVLAAGAVIAVYTIWGPRTLARSKVTVHPGLPGGGR
jgi:hypothetical protein